MKAGSEYSSVDYLQCNQTFERYNNMAGSSYDLEEIDNKGDLA